MDRAKRGWKWSIATDSAGLPLGWSCGLDRRSDRRQDLNADRQVVRTTGVGGPDRATVAGVHRPDDEQPAIPSLHLAEAMDLARLHRDRLPALISRRASFPEAGSPTGRSSIGQRQAWIAIRAERKVAASC